jgi:Tol biopolymer transport system component
LTESTDIQHPTSLSPDSTRLVFTQTTRGANEDVMMLTLTESAQAQPADPRSTSLPGRAQDLAARSEVRPLVQTPAAERNGEVSPDGRWLAYESDESGQ